MISEELQKFNEYDKLINDNPKIKIKVYQYLVKKGLNKSLKGFAYLVDMLTLMLVIKQYSKPFMAELFPYIAHKYGIQEYSVQRQLRYCCTITCKYHYVVNELCISAWYDIRTEIEEEKERKSLNVN